MYVYIYEKVGNKPKWKPSGENISNWKGLRNDLRSKILILFFMY